MLVVGDKIWGNAVTVTELFGILMAFATVIDSLDNPISGLKLDVSMIVCDDICILKVSCIEDKLYKCLFLKRKQR